MAVTLWSGRATPEEAHKEVCKWKRAIKRGIDPRVDVEHERQAEACPATQFTAVREEDWRCYVAKTGTEKKTRRGDRGSSSLERLESG